MTFCRCGHVGGIHHPMYDDVDGETVVVARECKQYDHDRDGGGNYCGCMDFEAFIPAITEIEEGT